MNEWLTASVWIGLALAAGLVSVRLGISVALTEIMFGVIGGNFLHLEVVPWVQMLAGFGSVFLTFLAGAEVDPVVLRDKFKESVSIGTASFLFPFAGAFAYAYWVAGWTMDASLIAGIALSTTSVAVVYAVMVETGLNETELGKIILAACFVTDLGTVLALGVFFANFNVWLGVFIGVSAVVLAATPKLTRWFTGRYGNRVSQMEAKYFFFLLFLLGGLALKANSEPVLPAYLIGLAAAGFFMEQKEFLSRLRAIAFAVLTPFYFLKAGLFVSLPAVVSGLLLITILLGVKMVTKFFGVWPLTRAFWFTPRDGMYTTLLMSTGLTFGTISSLFGLSHGIINQSQYTVLVTVVIGSAVVPTLIAQAFFRPQPESEEENGSRTVTRTSAEPLQKIAEGE
ncbi:MAG: cation:proton antiporter [Thermoanaerobacterales bacterium]|nr:cation:proton antiporter [Thermoanaerobacterales bacterium]